MVFLLVTYNSPFFFNSMRIYIVSIMTGSTDAFMLRCRPNFSKSRWVGFPSNCRMHLYTIMLRLFMSVSSTSFSNRTSLALFFHVDGSFPLSSSCLMRTSNPCCRWSIFVTCMCVGEHGINIASRSLRRIQYILSQVIFVEWTR